MGVGPGNEGEGAVAGSYSVVVDPGIVTSWFPRSVDHSKGL